MTLTKSATLSGGERDRRLFKRKKPWVSLQYEEEVRAHFSEEGVSSGAKLEDHFVSNPDLKTIFEASRDLDTAGLFRWIDDHAAEFEDTTFVVNTDDGEKLEALRPLRPGLIINKMALTRIRHLNTFLNKANETLAEGGYLWCHSRTGRLKKEIILRTHPGLPGKIIYFFHFLWHRVCAKLRFTRPFYFAVTRGKNRTYHHVELLGRMYRSGFEVVDERFLNGEYFIIGKKFRAPIWDDEPTNGLFVKLQRVGYEGKTIGVYKLRTMYAYSEYLQPYMLRYEGLRDGGKFANDYRVNTLGKICRKTWLDELPMLINVLKGQMKLVGVRPLSRHYFSLYTPEMQRKHISVKPGLLPPFYYETETPATLEEIQASEERYIDAWHKRPFATDWKYFWGTVWNILFKKKRSH